MKHAAAMLRDRHEAADAMQDALCVNVSDLRGNVGTLQGFFIVRSC